MVKIVPSKKMKKWETIVGVFRLYFAARVAYIEMYETCTNGYVNWIIIERCRHVLFGEIIGCITNN